MPSKKNEILNVQPHSIDAEQAVLGSMLSDKDSVNKVFEKKLSSEHFYKKSHNLSLMKLIHLLLLKV